MAKKRADKSETVAVSIDWSADVQAKSAYANNLRVQRTQSEAYLLFYEVTPPFLSGTPEEIKKAVSKLGPVRAECVGKIVVPIGLLANFSKVLASIVPEGSTEESTNGPE
jgi:hypothetical protein